MQEFQRIVNAARPVAELDPATAWELDEQLAAVAAIWPALAEVFASYAENLDRTLKVDPRIVQTFMAGVSEMADLYRTFGHTRALFRRLYEHAFEQAESAVRDISREKFWDSTAA